MKKQQPKPQSSAAAPQPAAKTDFFDKYANVIAIVLTALTAIVSLLLFNMRVDEGGDDSAYICRAFDLIESGRYPNYQGPLYPMFLAVIISLFGSSLFVLKLTSLLFITASQWIFYRSLRGRVNVRLILMVMALASINSWYLAYASLTYSEAMFIFVEFCITWLVLRFDAQECDGWLALIKRAAPIALLLVAAILIRTMALSIVVAVIIFMLVGRQWRKAVAVAGLTVVLSMAWIGVRTAIWSGKVDHGNSQLEQLMRKHPYEVEKGKEDFKGYLGRIVDNSNLYLSKRMMYVLGFKKEVDRKTSGFVTLLFYALFIAGGFFGYKRNRAVFWLAILTAAVLGLTFVMLQALWDQQRLIVPSIVTSFVVLLYGIYSLLRLATRKYAAYITMVMGAIVCLTSMVQTGDKIDLMALRKNMQGDNIYGYTTDFYNYLALCEYCGTLPEGSYVACRKPDMARIYCGGKKFFGIFNFTTEDADELIDNLRNHNVTHIIAASLRRDPLVPRDKIINTIHRYCYYVMQKYPKAFVFQKMMGSENNEPAQLFYIDYEHVDAVRRQLAAASSENENEAKADNSSN
ncbi:MAG: hypothetical protein IKR17_01755 [Bacteroidales bacterium]|nr:hypothetical protein [Bacteroidales bacterium]